MMIERVALKLLYINIFTTNIDFYHGKPLSEYCNENWVEDVVSVVESEIYNEDGENNARAYTNVKLAYDNIKTDFYQRLNS